MPKPPEKPKALPPGEFGDFRADGSWNPSASAHERGPRYAFVQSLCRALKAANLSPAQIAYRILASQFAGMFGELEQWSKITAWNEWRLAWTRTSADEAIKRAGVGSPDDSHWEGGKFVAGEDTRPFVQANPEHVASFVANIADRLVEHRPAWANPATPPAPTVSDQAFFEGQES